MTGDTLIFDLKLITPIRRGIVHMQGRAFVGDTLVSEASIFSATPAFELYVHTVHNDILKVRAFWKRPDREQLDAEGVPHQWDPDRFYAELPDGRMVLISSELLTERM